MLVENVLAPGVDGIAMVMRQSVTMSAAAIAAQHSSAKHVESIMAHPAGPTGMASGPSVTLERRGGRFSQVSSSFDAAASEQRRLWSRPVAASGAMVEITRPSGCGCGLWVCNSHVWGRCLNWESGAYSQRGCGCLWQAPASAGTQGWKFDRR